MRVPPAATGSIETADSWYWFLAVEWVDRITGVSPHLSSHFFQSSRPRAHDHQVKVIPSAPEGEPAGWAVGLAVLVAAQSAQGHKAIVDTHVYFRLAPAPGAEYAHI